jgi:4-hydroxy-tetrahydrodipicolinate synthase
LAAHKNIIGIKEASGNLEQCMKIAKEKPKDFMLISGDDMLTLPIYAIGGVGIISVLANALPQTFKKIKENYYAGKMLQAQTAQFSIIDINSPMYEEGNPVGVKYLLNLIGVCQPHVRLPLYGPSSALKKKITDLYKTL